MSILAISAVRTLPERGVELPPRDRFVLYALADYADDRLRAWPSYSTLASWTGYARSTIAESLADLEAAGLITSEQRRRDNGSHTSKVYELTFVRGAIPGAGTPPVREPDPQNHQIEPPEEPTPPSPPDELDRVIAEELEEGKERERSRRYRQHDRAVLATSHPRVWRSLAAISSSKRWSTEQLHAVARRVLELARDHGDDPVDELLAEILLNVAEIRSPIAYLERALAKRSARPAARGDRVDVDAIFGASS